MAAAALALWACTPPEPPPERAPTRDFENLVVIMIDTLRSDHLPGYGYPRPTAPFLAELATEGIQLQGYAASSWTRPSVATALTGLYPQRHRAIDRGDRLPRAVPYLPEILTGFGFHTAALITNGNVSTQFGFERGFASYEEWLDRGKPKASQVVEAVLERADELRVPYCLYLHFIDPHDPYVPRAPWGGTEEMRDSYVQPKAVRRGEIELDEATVASLVDQYDGEIAEMDRALRRLFEGLTEAGALDRTLVVVTSDHGEEFGEHGGVAHGRSLFEEVIKVPFILWGGPSLASYRSAAKFHQVDFLPTALAALGVPVPDGIDGRSRWAEIRDQKYQGREEQLFHLDRGGFQALAIHSPPFKLIRHDREPRELFYDLDHSTDETHPAILPAADAARIRKRLAHLDRDLEKRRYEREVTGISGKVRRQLRALGYLGGDDGTASTTDEGESKDSNQP